jgi:serine/threonine protein kinase
MATACLNYHHRASTMALGPGSRLDQYELLGVLGTGGMGEVYKARDLRLDRLVAVKVITSARDLDAESRKRFDREARSLAALSHPNICQIFHYGDADGAPFLVMEYLEGETLTERLRARGTLPLDEVLQHGAELASALEVAHRAGIVHRDLKPDNIMLTSGGLKLLDLGIAKRVVGGAEPSTTGTTRATVTALGVISGTLTYMAPEQMEGQGADARSDIFSFGAVLYEMTTGRRAFEGSSQAAIIASIMTGQPPRASSLNPAVPTEFDAVLERCLEKRPGNRFQRAAEVRDALRAIGSRSAKGGAPADREHAVGRTRKRRRIVISFSISISFLLLLAAFVNLQQGPPVSEATKQAAAQSAPASAIGTSAEPPGVRVSPSIPPPPRPVPQSPDLAAAPPNRPGMAGTPPSVRPGSSLTGAAEPSPTQPPRAQMPRPLPPPPGLPAASVVSAPTGIATGQPVAASETPPQVTITPEAHAKTEIERLVRNYCSALGTLQPEQLRKFYPQMDVALYRESFRQYRSLECTLDGPLEFDRLDASAAGGAQVRFGMKQQVEMKSGGRPQVVETITTMMVSRRDAQSPWLIDRVQHTPKPK